MFCVIVYYPGKIYFIRHNKTMFLNPCASNIALPRESMFPSKNAAHIHVFYEYFLNYHKFTIFKIGDFKRLICRMETM
jgi:hypothetical protein